MGAVGAIAPPRLAKTLRCFRAQIYSPVPSVCYAPRAPPPSLRTRPPPGLAPPLQIFFLHLCLKSLTRHLNVYVKHCNCHYSFASLYIYIFVPTDNTVMPVPINITQTNQTTRTINVTWTVCIYYIWMHR